jgi:ribose transport system permease protein
VGATVETLAAQSATQREIPESRLRSILGNQQVILLLFIAVMVVIFSVAESLFFSKSVLTNVLNDWCPIVLIGIGETFVIVTGGIDLSVGSALGLAGMGAALVMRSMTTSGTNQNLTLLVGVVIAVLIGITVGLVNSFLINKAKLVPFVATLATLGICAGLSVVWTKGSPVGGGPAKSIDMTVSHYGPFSNTMFMVFVIVLLSWLLLHFTRFGRHTFAIGSNPFAARAAGINVQRHVMKVYAFSGFMAGLAGMFYYLRLGTGSPSTGGQGELAAIAAVVIGGAALSGGVGRITGTVLGALVISTIASGLVMIGVPAPWRVVVVGTLIAIAGFIQGLLPGNRKPS